MPVVTQTPIELSHFVVDIAEQILTFNRIRWYRSRTGAKGLFEPATAAASSVATLAAGTDEPHALNGKTLSLLVNGVTQVDVLFASADPVTAAAAAAEVAAASALITAVDDDGYLSISTVAVGSGASIKVLESDAAPFLGWQTDDGAVGLDADTGLVAGTHEYRYTDQNSSSDFWYTAELRHSVTAQVAEHSMPFRANAADRVSWDQTIMAYLRLCDLSGYPIACRDVVIHNVFLPNKAGASSEWGVFRHSKTVSTNEDGYAAVRVLRGIQVDVVISGTGFVRRVTIPTTGDAVDLLDPTLQHQDEFGIHVPDIDFAIRTTL